MANSCIVKFPGETICFQLRFELPFLCLWRISQFGKKYKHILQPCSEYFQLSAILLIRYIIVLILLKDFASK